MRFLMMGYSEEDERVQAIESLGHTIDVSEADSEAWQNAARTQYDTIWVNWSEADHSIRPLVQYRALRPLTRIILEVPAELEPPNSEVAQWVQLGVYDIARSQSDFSLVIQNPATIADALRWTGLTPTKTERDGANADTASEPAPVKVIEKVVRVPLSSRPVLIVVAGVSPGVGTTTAAVGIARYLSRRETVALGEYGVAALEDWRTDLRANGLTVQSHPAPSPLDLVRRHDWAYIVADVGAPTGWSEIVEWQPDLLVLVGPGETRRLARWRLAGVASTLGELGDTRIAPVLVGGRSGETCQVIDALARDASWDATALPPLDVAAKVWDAAWVTVLAPVLGEPSGRRPRRVPTPRRASAAPLQAPAPAVSPTPAEVRVQITPAAPRRALTPMRMLRGIGTAIEWAIIAALLAGMVWVLGAIASHHLFPAFTASSIGRLLSHIGHAEGRWVMHLTQHFTGY